MPQELQRVTPLSIRLATHAQVGLAMRERYPVLRDISASIQTRRTVEESELALKLEEEFRADPCRKQCRPAQPQLFGRGWSRLTEARGSLRHDLALKAASGEPAVESRATFSST